MFKKILSLALSGLLIASTAFGAGMTKVENESVEAASVVAWGTADSGDTIVRFKTESDGTVHAAVSGNLTGPITITENSDTQTFTNDGTDTFHKWSDGVHYMQTDEGTNTATYVRVKGKGTGDGAIQVWDGTETDEYVTFGKSGVAGYIGSGAGMTSFAINSDNRNMDVNINGDVTTGLFKVDAGDETVTTQRAGASKHTQMYIDNYSATDAYEAQLFLRKSISNTLGTLTPTETGDELGAIYIQGVDVGSARDGGVRMTVTQNGAASSGVPVEFDLETRTAAGAWNDGQVRLDSNGVTSVNSISTTKTALLVDANGATGATGEASVRIDSEQTDTASLYVTGKQDSSGTDPYYDDAAVCIVQEGNGKGLSVYRNITSGNNYLFEVYDDHVDSQGYVFRVISDSDASAVSNMASFQSSNAGFDKSTVLINRDTTTGASGENALRIDSEDPDAAALYITSAVDASGTELYDDFAAAIEAEGIGGGLSVHKNVATGNRPLVRIENEHVDTTNNTLHVKSAQDATGNVAVAHIESTSSACDQPALQVTQAGNSAAISVPSSGITTNSSLVVEQQNSLTSGGIAYLHSNSSDTTARELVHIVNDNASANNTISLFVDDDATTGTTGQATVKIDSEQTDTAALYITSANDGSGSAGDYDDHALAVQSEGAGGVASFHRDVAGTSSGIPMVYLWDDNIDTTSTTLKVLCDADASAVEDAVVIRQSNTAFDRSTLFVNSDSTAGSTGLASVRIDSEQTDVAALYITSAVDETGTSAIYDDSALAVVSENHGGAAYFYRNFASAVTPLVQMKDDNVDSIETVLEVTTDADASSQQPAFVVATTNAAFDQVAAKITQAGVVSTNFKKVLQLDTFTIWVSDGTTAEGALTGVEGDICLNGGTGAGQMAYCDANGTNWTDM